MLFSLAYFTVLILPSKPLISNPPGITIHFADFKAFQAFSYVYLQASF